MTTKTMIVTVEEIVIPNLLRQKKGQRCKQQRFVRLLKTSRHMDGKVHPLVLIFFFFGCV